MDAEFIKNIEFIIKSQGQRLSELEREVIELKKRLKNDS